MAKPPSAKSILRNMKKQKYEPKTPIASEMFLPNYSGIKHKLQSNVNLGTQGSVLFLDSKGNIAEDNSKLFWNNTNNFLGVGTNTPEAQLHTSADGGVGHGMIIANHVSSLHSASINFRKSRGSKAAPLDVVDQDYGGVFFWEHYQGGIYRHTAGFGTSINGAVSDNNVPTNLWFFTSKTHQSDPYPTHVKMLIDENGNIGIGSTNPQGKLHVGDQATNYLKIANDGELTLVGTARVKKKIYIDANGIRAPGAKPATFVEDGLTGCWEFADAIEANQESVSGTLLILPDMDRSMPITLNVGWHANGVSPGNCKWQLEYLWISPNEDVTAGAQETLTKVSTASATSDGLVIAEITGIDLPSSTDKALFWKLTRLSADAEDTISDVVHLRGQFFEYTSNKLREAT